MRLGVVRSEALDTVTPLFFSSASIRILPMAATLHSSAGSDTARSGLDEQARRQSELQEWFRKMEQLVNSKENQTDGQTKIGRGSKQSAGNPWTVQKALDSFDELAKSRAQALKERDEATQEASRQRARIKTLEVQLERQSRLAATQEEAFNRLAQRMIELGRSATLN